MVHIDQPLSSVLAGSPLAPVVEAIAASSQEIATALAHGALRGHHGEVGEENVQGEAQQRLDVIADLAMRRHLLESGVVAAVASEEEEGLHLAEQPGRPWLVAYDPLDGSSNIDVNISVGSIFSIRPAPGHAPTIADFLVPGRAQAAAGYVLYGPSTQLVLTLGDGVHVFTLDPDDGVFYTTRVHVKVEREAREFAINASNRRRWDAPVRRWFDEVLEGAEGPRGRDFNTRWIATLVAEVHRILVRGGVFSYPMDAKLRAQGKAGRLRLVYELAPMALLLEQAGAAASDGQRPLLDIVPDDLHARSPAFLGAADEVERLERYHGG